MVIYWFGLDDTAEFYLYEDAHEFQIQQQEIDTRFRTVTQTLGSLNEREQNNFNHGVPWEQPTLISENGLDTYYLKLPPLHNAPALYVLHRFEQHQSLDIKPLLFTVTSMMLCVLAIVIFFVLRKVRQQTHYFRTNIEQLASHHTIIFSELALAQQAILDAVTEQKNAVKREYEFASFLSHEIRQPLTLIGHQLARFDQLDMLPPPSLSLIDALKHAQRDTTQLCDTILNLWQPQDCNVSSKTKINQTLLEWANTSDADIQVELLAPEHYLQLTKPELALLLKQIETNFNKYGIAPLKVTVHSQYLQFENAINEELFHQSSHGIGMFIIKAIAKKANWQLTSSQTEFTFSLKLTKL
ncbi:HAMP domain-containing histidine kinase [Pseudoalteromonas sp. CO348]|uniref:HAMP domain-containing histidine kinase n=1 Tax=Pseudoalteromonas sp. CO348 TaxID=1777271 RepID=UPI001023214E|nr:HAMP domain-containing histidine kinase [Pseudoalteromonas sp. CO348]RZF98724.1 HAMP domain-containing histidine kinase [Pseudoalteromonas sp. CO348]